MGSGYDETTADFRMVGQNGKWQNGVMLLVVLLLAITSRLLFSIAICCDITSFAICHVGQSF